jgi:hypothetical protein
MAIAVQRSGETQIALTPIALNPVALTPAAGASARSVIRRIANLWPAAMIIFALILTVCWNAGLFLLVWRFA